MILGFGASDIYGFTASAIGFQDVLIGFRVQGMEF